MPAKRSTNSDDDRRSAQICVNSDRVLRVEYRPLENLIPYARNARTHSEAQVAQIAASIKEFGWTNPVLVDGDNGVIAGHGRLLASRKLGMVEVPVIELAGLSDAAKRAYILADNKLALNAGWDEAMLSLEVGELSALGVDLTLAGFSDRELQALGADQNPGLTDPDETPEPPAEPVTKLGDVWVLGRHRLICGDCTNPAIVAEVLGPVTPHLMVTDPPYGVSGAMRSCATMVARLRRVRLERCSTTTALTGARLGRYFQATSPASGTVRCTPERWPKVLKHRALPFGRRASGTKHDWSLAAAITTGSTNPPGMPSGKARPAIGREIASKRLSGASRI